MQYVRSALLNFCSTCSPRVSCHSGQLAAARIALAQRESKAWNRSCWNEVCWFLRPNFPRPFPATITLYGSRTWAYGYMATSNHIGHRRAFLSCPAGPSL